MSIISIYIYVIRFFYISILHYIFYNEFHTQWTFNLFGFACMCVVCLAFFSMKEKMAINETHTAIYYSQCLFSAHIIWVHRFIIIDYNSYHLWKCECWIRQERKMGNHSSFLVDREKKILSFEYKFFFSFTLKSWKLLPIVGPMTESQHFGSFSLWWNVQRRTSKIPCCSQSTLLQKRGSNITICLSIARLVRTINEGGAII